MNTPADIQPLLTDLRAARALRLAYSWRHARRGARFHIWLLQYDGFTIRVQKEQYEERFVRRLQKAVDKRARELSIITHLERKQG